MSKTALPCSTVRILSLLGLLALTALATLNVEGNATSVNVTINSSSVSVNLNLVMQENLTKAIPLVSFTVNNSNTTNGAYATLLASFQTAMNQAAPTARVNALSAHVRSFQESLNGAIQLQENYSLVVSGVVTNNGVRETADLSFLNFNVTNSLSIGGIELNYLGATYLAPAMVAANQSSTKPGFFLNGEGPFPGIAIPLVTTQHFHLLDFHWTLATGLWDAQQSFDAPSTWTYDPFISVYNLTIGEVPNPEHTYQRYLMAVYNPDFQANAPPRAKLQSNTIILDLPNSYEIIMPIIIAAAISLLAISVLIDRRLTKVKRAKKKK